MNRLFSFALSLPILAGALACSTVHVSVPVTRPAEINMARYRQLAVERFEGRTGTEVANLLQQELVRSQRFQVVNRQNLDRIMRELQLSASDLSDPSKAIRLGKQLPASALIFGHVEESDYYEDPVTWTEYETTDDKGRKTRHRRFYRNGVSRVRVTFHIDDVETGQIVTSRTFQHEETASTTAVDRQPAFIDGNALVLRGRSNVVGQFMRSIVPWTEWEQAPFEKDGKLPQLESAITYCRMGEWDQAYDVATRAIDEGERQGLPSKVLAKAYWNRGLIGKYTGRFEEARTDVKRAFEYTNDDKFLYEIRRIDEAEINARRLQEQNASVATGNDS